MLLFTSCENHVVFTYRTAVLSSVYDMLRSRYSQYGIRDLLYSYQEPVAKRSDMLFENFWTIVKYKIKTILVKI